MSNLTKTIVSLALASNVSLGVGNTEEKSIVENTEEKSIVEVFDMKQSVSEIFNHCKPGDIRLLHIGQTHYPSLDPNSFDNETAVAVLRSQKTIDSILDEIIKDNRGLPLGLEGYDIGSFEENMKDQVEERINKNLKGAIHPLIAGAGEWCVSQGRCAGIEIEDKKTAYNSFMSYVNLYKGVKIHEGRSKECDYLIEKNIMEPSKIMQGNSKISLLQKVCNLSDEQLEKTKKDIESVKNSFEQREQLVVDQMVKAAINTPYTQILNKKESNTPWLYNPLDGAFIMGGGHDFSDNARESEKKTGISICFDSVNTSKEYDQ